MRNFIIAGLAAATALVPVAASAQSYGEARQSQREVRESRPVHGQMRKSRITGSGGFAVWRRPQLVI